MGSGIAFDPGGGNALGIINGQQGRYANTELGRASGITGIAIDMFCRKSGFTEMLFSADSTMSWMAFTNLQQPMANIEDIFNAKTVFL